ncbi:MAG TPA: glycoside hydrolase family 44 protein [Terriglobales bacterium]|nr:glycoside hydrolase family 44 protein [Terriglobales bacterium]
MLRINKLAALLLALLMFGCGGGGNSDGGGGGGGNPPAVPTGVAGFAGDQQIMLQWTASSGATSYHVKRSGTSGGPYSTIGSPTTLAYTDTGLTNGTTYYYVVSAVNSHGESANSKEVIGQPTAGPPPSAPTGVTATPGDKQVSLSWNASSGATSYHVERATTSGGPYSQIAAPTTTSYTDTGLTNGTTYYYVITALNAGGESGNSSEVSAKPAGSPPATPTGLAATAGDQQVSLTWNASAGATSYHVKRSTASGGPYSQVAAPTVTNYTDTGLTNGTTYYYVVSALNANGESANSSEKAATPSGTASVHVNVDVLANRHTISPYIYGGSYPQNTTAVTDSGLTVVRWGGNATSTYNWQLHTYNADNDWYFEDFDAGGFNDGSAGDSVTWINNVKTAGSNPLMTMVMLNWVAKSRETSTQQGDPSNNFHWSFSVSKYGAQCSVDPYNNDAGNGVKADCSTPLIADPNDAYFPLLDDHSASCPGGTTCYYRNDWAAALATAFGSAPHFYDMDNETDIWGGTHRDIHPTAAAYEELRDVYLAQARKLKTWDPAAIRLGPVSCCWWFYWNGADSNDKAAHGGVDFVPWWLNEVYWQDKIAGSRSLDIFDIHAYPDADTGSLNTTQKKALAARIYRDWWDPTYVSESSTINQPWTTQIQPNKTIAFRIPRMRAIANATYPGTPLAFTEWSAEFAGAADFSTALGDADAYGILGRERVYLASRWVAPAPSQPNYLALKLYTNYDGAHHGFGTMSVAATHDADVNLFSSFAALHANGTTATVLLINKDPSNSQTAQVTLNGFTPNQVTTYTLSSASPSTIVAFGPRAWTSNFALAPYSMTLLVVTGTMAHTPAAEWDLNPDVITVPANGTVALSPKIVSGAGTVTLSSPQSDVGITLTLTQPNLTTSQNGTITVNAGNTPGFYHFTVTGMDGSGVSQDQSGWILVGNSPATLSKTGDPGSGPHGSNITLQVTMNAGSSGGSNSGASIFFTTDAGTLNNRIVKTNGSGQASVVLTLPNSTGTVHVTAEGPYELGHPVVTFTEQSQ